MYKRDIAVVLLSCVALYLSLQHEGTFSFRKSWFHLHKHEGANLDALRFSLPPPVVADLNGDGSFEVIVATRDHRLLVLNPHGGDAHADGFTPAKLVAEVSLQPQRVTLDADLRAVAVAAGYIDPPATELVRAPRKAVVVVVTASWHVMMFDHNLQRMWEHTLADDLPPHAHVKEVAILVTHQRVKAGDRGLIVVGGRLELGDLAAAAGLEDEVEGEGGGLGNSEDVDPLLAELRREKETSQHVHSAGRDDPLSEVGGASKGGADMSRHFNLYAWEGASGGERWHHTSADFHRDVDTLADELHPRDDFRLDAEKLTSRHFGEVSCREYRESLVAEALPHAWHSPRDTALTQAHFRRHREGRGAQRQGLADKPVPGKTAGGAARHGGRESSGRGGRGGAAGAGKTWFSMFKGGGGAAARRAAAAHSRQHHSARGGAELSAAAARGNFTPNAIVAHLQGGVEVLHLYSGRTLCQLSLLPEQLHADINGDGVVDHVALYGMHRGGAAAAGDAAAANAGVTPQHRHASRCSTVVQSGIPPRYQLFSTKVCGGDAHELGVLSDAHTDEGVPEFAAHVQLAPPAALPLPRADGTYPPRGHQHSLLAFLNSHGLITAVSSTGKHVWQTYFGTFWDPEAATPAVPTLRPLALRVGALPAVLLAAGADYFVLVSEHGHDLGTYTLPGAPTQPISAADFNGDGLNDLIVVTAEGVFGYVQVHHVGGVALSALLLTLVVALAALLYTQHFMGGRRTRKLRSTEYTD